MAVVKPFTALRYNSSKIKNPAEVVVPPYDVISDEQLAQMKKRNSHNYAPIILGEGENKHQKAAQLLSQWQKEEVLVFDKKPSLYFYKQTFKLNRHELFCQDVSAGTLVRTGIFARIGLEDYSSKIILPHEKTFSGPKADRYQLMTEAQGNMEPVFLGYDSPRFSGDEFEKIILGHEPLYSYTDDSSVRHELWAIDDAKVHEEVEKVLGPLKFYILDGHHRYETALQFYKDHQKNDARLSHRYVLANICSFKQPGTVILPTHRLVRGLNGFSKSALMARLRADFEIGENVSLDGLEAALKESKTPAFGLLLEGSADHFVMKLRESSPIAKDSKLDLEVLHELIIERLLEPGTGQKNESLDIAYVKSIGEVGEKMTASEYQVGFLVRPSSCDEVMGVAGKMGKMGKMPHKSTFFYPKIPSGLVINKFE